MIEAGNYEIGIANVDGQTLDDIVLLTIAQTTETIEVSGEAPPAAPGAAKLDRQELQRMPGTGGDVVRALTAMPGVVNLQMPLGYSGVVIRGSSPQDSKVLVDDFEIPVLFHNIGFRAVVPAEAIAVARLHPGRLRRRLRPRVVGHRRRSTTRAGSDERTTQAEVSLIDGGLLAQGTLGPKTRYMFGLRRSTIDFVLPSIIPDSVDLSLTTVPSYYDEQFRIDHELNEKWTLRCRASARRHVRAATRRRTTTPDKRFFNRTRFMRLTAAARYHDGPWTANLALSGPRAGVHVRGRAVPADRRHGSRRSRRAPRSCARGRRRSGSRTSSGAPAPRRRSAATSIDIALPRERREGEPIAALRSEGHLAQLQRARLDPRLRGVDVGDARTSIRAMRATTGAARRRVRASRRESRSQPRGEIQVKLTPTLTARLPSGAYRRPPEFQTENLYTNIEAEHSTQIDRRPAVRAAATACACRRSAYYTDRTQLITRDDDGTTRQQRPRHDRTAPSCSRRIAAARGSRWLSYSYSHSTRVDHPGEPERLFTFDQPHSLNAAASWKRQALAARRSVPAVLGPAVHAGDRRRCSTAIATSTSRSTAR